MRALPAIACTFWLGTAWGVLTGTEWVDDSPAVNVFAALGFAALWGLLHQIQRRLETK